MSEMEKDFKDLKIGHKFELIEVKRSYLREWTRTGIAMLIVLACLVATAVAAVFEIRAGGNVLLKVWAVTGPLLVSVTAFYFGGSGPRAKDDDQSAVRDAEKIV